MFIIFTIFFLLPVLPIPPKNMATPDVVRILKYRNLRAKSKILVSRKSTQCSLNQQQQKEKTDCIFNLFELVANDCPDKVIALLIDIDPSIKIGKKHLMKIIDRHQLIDHFIVLVTSISSPAEKAIAEIKTKHIEIIFRKDIAWAKPSYCLVPHYELLTLDQIQQFEEKYKVKVETNLPRMCIDDAMAIHFGFEPGDVVHAIETDIYRYVTHQKKKK